MSDDERQEHDDESFTAAIDRRDFLKAGVAAAGASVLSACGGGSGGSSSEDVPEIVGAESPISRIDHFVTVMFENRSLDNLLGYVYPDNAAFNGLSGKSFSNPVPPFIDDGHTSVFAAPSPGTDADMQNPNPDPGEPFPRINTQLFGLVDPATNAFESTTQMKAPYNTPPAGTAPTMQGFVHDYCNTFVQTQGRNPTYDEYRVIMDIFTPTQLPVLSALARKFAVYDAWYCAVPSQTYCNRSFFHASTSSGFVLNAPYKKWLEQNTSPTLFNRLQDAGRSWCIYFDDSQLVSLTGLIHAIPLLPYFKTNFGTMQDFYSDVANGTLPDYAFIEPRMLWNHNDFHPPGPLVVDGLKIPDPSDVRCGDLLLHDIYSAIRTSASTTGSNAGNTMLLVTFDEHGGCVDHVAPPGGTSPDNPQPAGEMGFFFDRLGVRVPTIAISAYTGSGTIVSDPVHHAALIRTLSRKWGLPYLTQRDRKAPDLSAALNLAVPRAISTWPVTVPRPVPPDATVTDPTSATLSPVPLNDLARHIVGLALTHFTGQEIAQDAIPTTAGAAYAALAPLARGAFGRTPR